MNKTVEVKNKSQNIRKVQLGFFFLLFLVFLLFLYVFFMLLQQFSI